jgi:hypothetical protein
MCNVVMVLNWELIPAPTFHVAYAMLLAKATKKLCGDQPPGELQIFYKTSNTLLCVP